ncbi:DUF4159 domain-containing protein [Pelatocladus sp. BLCC-F211]|uniref:DUF4159 domain-containing protein n=1 Tax=Pelatocladus sp. BLCC-F211 TaxID=3342752 RepID=UPI0035B76DEC
MSHPFPPPPIQPFERLQASDGLLINAERWRRAHEYHRQRQNAHYQCINQPGIVCGLGVRVIAAPRQIEAKYRDERWVQIQPGIAINIAGNLIIVPHPIDFRIATEVTGNEPVMVYLIASYVDPDELRHGSQREVVQETFRIDEKSTTPPNSDVEICRVLLQPGPVKISPTADVFFPGYNNIDLRYRRQAQARPQAIVRMAQVNHNDPECARNFFQISYLLQAVEPLYPYLRGADELGQVTFNDHQIQEYDLLYFTGKQALSLNSRELELLKSYLNQGGVLLVDAQPDANALIESTQALAQQLESPLRPLEECRRDHPLRTQPFLFAALPIIHQLPIRLLTGGGIILVIGDLASAWGLDQELSLPRMIIRTAQELGVNILNFAWKRRQLIGLQQEDVSGQW